MYTIHVIEFQTRGLTQAHILVKMENEPTFAAQIDEVITAELPTDPDLRKKIQKNMFHSAHTSQVLSLSVRDRCRIIPLSVPSSTQWGNVYQRCRVPEVQ